MDAHQADTELQLQLKMAAMIIRLFEIEADARNDTEVDDADTMHPLEELMTVFSETAASFPYSKCQVDEMRDSFKKQVNNHISNVHHDHLLPNLSLQLQFRMSNDGRVNEIFTNNFYSCTLIVVI